jgi:hypothetical protein
VEHELALAAAEREDMVAIRVIRSPPEWRELLDTLMDEGDCEGNIWECDVDLNDRLRVVAFAKSGKTCWFSVFLKREVFEGLKFVDGIYDLARNELAPPGTFATVDNIFSRRGVDYGGIVEIMPDKSKHFLGYKAIEDKDPVALWRLTFKLSAEMTKVLNLQADTVLCIRTRYRSEAKVQIHTLMVKDAARQKGLEWKLLQKQRELKGKPLHFIVDERLFLVTDFPRAESAYAPINDARMEQLRVADLESQGRRCTVLNLPEDCDPTRIAKLLTNRGFALEEEPTVIRSKHTSGTSVAFVRFVEEEQAFNAIMDAPSMRMGGRTLVIKPTQPKAQRPLSKIVADEQKRLEQNGPSDGMNERQIKSLLETIQAATDTQLAELKKQFIVDRSGTFANSMVNMVRDEIDSVKAEVNQVKEDVLNALADMDECLTAEAESQVSRHTELSESLLGIKADNGNTAKSMSEDLKAIARIVERSETTASSEMEQINTRLDMLQNAIIAFTGMSISSSQAKKRPPPSMNPPQDSDDSDGETTAQDEELGPLPPNAKLADMVFTGNMLDYPEQLSHIKLGSDMTAEQCVVLVQARNRLEPPPSMFQWPGMVQELLPIGLLALERLAQLATKNGAKGKKGKEAAKMLTALGKMPPNAEASNPLSQSSKENQGPGGTHLVPNSESPPKSGKRSADQARSTRGARGDATDMDHEEVPTDTRSTKKAPPATWQDLPDCTLEEALDHIAFLQGCYPEHEGFIALSQGDERTLVARGNKARRILMDETPHSSQDSDGSERARNTNQATKYQRK